MKISNNKIYKLLCLSAILFTFCTQNYSQAAAVADPVKKESVQKTAAVSDSINVSPVDVVNNPSAYLNKNITFNAEFVAFTSLGLDYKPAFRDSSKYIGILIRRNDVNDHIIPLSEMKIFLDRETAEKYVDLESGDKIKITGTVFSCALGDPWTDVKSFTVLTQKKKDKTTK